tara:strand:+ start:4875 stop:5366 length:492 start_codon:yes stop_codon:yes gene_type:complete
MSTFNRTYRSSKFFLCIHTTDEYHIALEKAENRFTHFSFICWGAGKLHIMKEGKFETIESMGIKNLFDVSDIINCNVVGETYEKTKAISFNSWKKNDKWNGRILKTGKIKSDKHYSCVIAFEGSCKINGKEINEMDYADLKQSKEYDIIVPDNSSIAFFELCS